MEKQNNFDERYHASYTAKLKTIPLDKIEHSIAKALGELTNDRVECTVSNFNAEKEDPEILITLHIGEDKRYTK